MEMTLHDLIYSRHSIRKFTDQPVPDEDVLKILDAIRVGPSSENYASLRSDTVTNRNDYVETI
jgi:nitroreductase